VIIFHLLQEKKLNKKNTKQKNETPAINETKQKRKDTATTKKLKLDIRTYVGRALTSTGGSVF